MTQIFKKKVTDNISIPKRKQYHNDTCI